MTAEQIEAVFEGLQGLVMMGALAVWFYWLGKRM